MNFWRRILLALVCGVAVGSIYAAQSILVSIGHDLGLPVGLTGWIISAGHLGYLIGLIALVPLGDVVDRRLLIVMHLVFTAIGMAITASALNAWMLFGGLALSGLFAVVVQIAVAYTASVSSSDERGKNLGVVTSGVVMGILSVRVISGALTNIYGWRSVYATLSALSCGLAVLVLLALPGEERSDRSIGYKQTIVLFAGLFKQRIFLMRGCMAFCVFASLGTLWSGMSLPLTSAPWYLNESQIGLLGIVGIAGALGAARAGHWADAGWASQVIGFSLLLLILSWGAIMQLPRSLTFLFIGIIVLDFAVQAVQVSNQHILTTAYPDRLSSAIGGYMVFYSVGSALGAVATTALYTLSSWMGSSLFGAGFALGGLIFWAIDRKLSRNTMELRSPCKSLRCEI